MEEIIHNDHGSNSQEGTAVVVPITESLIRTGKEINARVHPPIPESSKSANSKSLLGRVS